MPRIQVTPSFVVILLMVGGFTAQHLMDRRITHVPELPRQTGDPLSPANLEELSRRVDEWAITTTRLPWIWIVAAGIGVALVYALSILAHELGHYGAAKLLKVDVEGITLQATGGFVELADDTWLTRWRFAVIVACGPFVTALLLVAAHALSTHEFAETAEGIVAERLVSVALWTNAIALVLNLFPFRGLDGWHLLSSSRWFQNLA